MPAVSVRYRAHRAAPVGEAVREAARTSSSGGCAPTRRRSRRARRSWRAPALAGRSAVFDVGDAGGEAFAVRRDLADHGPGARVSLPVLKAGGSSTDGVEKFEWVRAAAPALAAVVAGRAAVQGLREDREPRRDAGDLQAVAGLLDEPLVGPRRGRGHEDPVGLVGQALVRAEEPDVARRACRSTASGRRRRWASRRPARRGSGALKS